MAPSPYNLGDGLADVVAPSSVAVVGSHLCGVLVSVRVMPCFFHFVPDPSSCTSATLSMLRVGLVMPFVGGLLAD